MLGVTRAMSFPPSGTLESPPNIAAQVGAEKRGASSSSLHPKRPSDIPGAPLGAGRGHKEKWSVEGRRHVGKPGFEQKQRVSLCVPRGRHRGQGGMETIVNRLQIVS